MDKYKSEENIDNIRIKKELRSKERQITMKYEDIPGTINIAQGKVELATEESMRYGACTVTYFLVEELKGEIKKAPGMEIDIESTLL